MHLKILCGKWQPFCLRLNVLRNSNDIKIFLSLLAILSDIYQMVTYCIVTCLTYWSCQNIVAVAQKCMKQKQYPGTSIIIIQQVCLALDNPNGIYQLTSLVFPFRLVPKLIRRRRKSPDYKNKSVFGVPLSVVVQRTGQPLPQCMLHAMRCLRRSAAQAHGVFRKAGVRSRIQQLHNQLEADPGKEAHTRLYLLYFHIQVICHWLLCAISQIPQCIRQIPQCTIL